MRAYFFGNMYLSSIQQGIQAKHVGDEMDLKYFPMPTEVGECCFHATQQTVTLADWKKNHKTVVLLNAGYSSTIRDIQAFMMDNDNHYPWAVFHEGDDALDGALTGLGIILPEKIYEAARLVRQRCTGWDRVRLVRDIIWEDGELKVVPGNPYGIETEDHLLWTYNKWEAKLIDELNKYGLAK